MRFWVLMLLLLLSACSSTTINKNYAQTVSSWHWANSNQLLQVWGTPSRIGRLPNGNKVLIYQKETYKNYPPPPLTANFATVNVSNGRSFIVVPNPNPAPAPSGPSYLLKCITLFEIDPQNIVVNVRAQGNNCTADRGFMLSKSNPHPMGDLEQPPRESGPP